ncbi:MAG: YkgJ family cysteine cluster protein [Peptostreptococcaceae bacterium]
MASIKKKEIIDSIEYIYKNNLFNKLNKIYKSVPSGKCTGCGSCCMESVSISLVEFLNIYNFLQDNKEIKNNSLAKVLDYYFLEYTKKSPCPFRDDKNMCMIYEVRPLNCRIFGHWTEKDYNKNLNNVTNKNKEYKDLIKSKYEFDISDEVVNYKINYCKSFIPDNDYLKKSERLNFSDQIMCLDSKILGSEIIDIEFKDRGIVEYFIESLLYENLAYDIKIKVSKDENIRNVCMNRMKGLFIDKN